MNCHECQELTQRFLDGESIDDFHADLDLHLAICTPCREQHAAGQCLIEGLRLFAPPMPPARLSSKITSAVLARRRRLRFQRRLTVAGALAASLLLALLAGYRTFEIKQTQQDEAALAPNPLPLDSSEAISLDQRVQEAGEAVVALTRRTADETVGQGRVLLPKVTSESLSALTQETMHQQLPPGTSLREVQQSMAVGFEPVTTSARRAVDLFLREIPPVGFEQKPGL